MPRSRLDHSSEYRIRGHDPALCRCVGACRKPRLAFPADLLSFGERSRSRNGRLDRQVGYPETTAEARIAKRWSVLEAIAATRRMLFRQERCGRDNRFERRYS